MKHARHILLWFLPLAASALTYDEWKLAKFTTAELADPGISGPSADPDSDGRSNYGEFALDSNPKVQDLNASFDVFVDNDGKWSIKFLRWKQPQPALHPAGDFDTERALDQRLDAHGSSLPRRSGRPKRMGHHA